MIKIGSFLTELLKNENVIIFSDTVYMRNSFYVLNCDGLVSASTGDDNEGPLLTLMTLQGQGRPAT